MQIQSEISPRITVILPINKDDGFFYPALDSVLNQTFKDFELLLIANNCSDELWAGILEISDSRVKPKRLSMGGLAFALNTGISQARGEFIARMDADDLSLPNRLQSQLNFMDKSPEVDILGGRVKFINSKNEVLNEEAPFFEKHAEIISALRYRNPMVHPAVFVRRNVLLNSGGYKYGFNGEDYELWIRLMLSGNIFHNLDEDVLLYRRHESQMTSEDKSYLIFCDVATLLFMYFLRMKDLRFIVGAFLKIPLVRRLRKLFMVF